MTASAVAVSDSLTRKGRDWKEQHSIILDLLSRLSSKLREFRSIGYLDIRYIPLSLGVD